MLRLYDTARREVVPFAPEHVVRMYVCGITPYDSTHLGHAATYLTYDLLIRRLEELGHEVRMVRNITDVDDSILPKARELGVPYLELAEAEIARFHSDMDALGMRPPIAEPRATETIDEIIVDRRAAARLRATRTSPHGTAYFDVSTSPRLRRALALLPGPDGAARPGPRRQPRRPAPARPARLRALAAVARRRARVARAVRRRPARLAHRVLGDVDAGARPDARPARRRHRPDLPAPRVRDRAERGAHRQAVRAALAALGDGRLRGREDEQVARQPRLHQRPAEGGRPARDPARARCTTTTGPASSGTTPTSRTATRCCTGSSPRPQRTTGPDPTPFAVRVRAAIDHDLDAPRALEALGELADAVLSGGDDETAPDVLRELSAPARHQPHGARSPTTPA